MRSEVSAAVARAIADQPVRAVGAASFLGNSIFGLFGARIGALLDNNQKNRLPD